MAEQHEPKPVDTDLDRHGGKDMHAAEIFERMRGEGVNGSKSLGQAANAARTVKGHLHEVEQAVRKYQQCIANGLHGDGGDKAHHAAKPIIDRLSKHQEDLDMHHTMSSHQVADFDKHSGQLEKVSADPPGFWSRAGHTINPLSEADPSNDTEAWHRANRQNKWTYQSYGTQTSASAGAMPGESPPPVNTFANTEIYNPNRTPGHHGGDDVNQLHNGHDPGPGPDPQGHHRGPGHVTPPPPGRHGHDHGPHGRPPHGRSHDPAGQPNPDGTGHQGAPRTHTPPPGQLATATGSAPGTGDPSFGSGQDGFAGRGGYSGSGSRSGGADFGGFGGGFGAGGGSGAGRGGLGAGGGSGPGQGGSGQGGSGQGGPGRGGSTGAGPRSGATGAGESGGAGRAGAGGGAGGRGPGGMPMGGRGGRKQEDEEHETPSYLINENNGNKIVGDLPPTAPPVIGA